jgi:hypothetical protein
MGRPEKVYLEDPITISGTKVNHTEAGLKYLIDHYRHMLSFPINEAKLKATDRQHIEKLIDNYTFHLQLYDHDKNGRSEANRTPDVLSDHNENDQREKTEFERVASIHDP